MIGSIRVRHLIATLSTLLLVGGATQPAFAQSQYFVSARAGLVNYERGQVVYKAKSATSWEQLNEQAQLDDGDHIRTKLDGRVEILLNPGSTLRLDTNSEAILLRADLPLIELELLSGNAMIEAGDLGENVVIRVKTPHTSVRIKKDGLYRIDAHSAQTRISVRKGELEYLTRGDMKKLKKDKQAVLNESSVEIVKLDENQPLDDFDLWVKDRAEIMIAANQSLLRRRSFGTSLYASSWVYDPFFGCYTFVPYGYLYRSPWGGRFIYYAPYYSFYGYGYWPGYYPNGGYYGGGGSRLPTPNQSPALTANESKVGLRVGGARAERGDFTRPDRVSNEGGGRIFPTPRNDAGFNRGGPDVFSSPSPRGSMGNTGTVSVPASAPASAPVSAPRTEGGARETGTRGRGRP